MPILIQIANLTCISGLDVFSSSNSQSRSLLTSECISLQKRLDDDKRICKKSFPSPSPGKLCSPKCTWLRSWRLQLHVADEGGKCPVWPPVTSRLQPGAEWSSNYFLPPEISNTMNSTLYCTLIQFTIFEIVTKVWRERWRVDGMAPHYCSCPRDWRGTPGTWVHQRPCTASSGAFVAQIYMVTVIWYRS